MMRVEGTVRLAKKIILLIIISLLFLTAIQSLPEVPLIQTDKAEYTIGEAVSVTVTDANTNQQNLYYEYEGFTQRYMGDYTSFSFAPVGIGTHYLILRDKAGNEITRTSFEMIAGEEQQPPIEEQPAEEQPVEESVIPEEPTTSTEEPLIPEEPIEEETVLIPIDELIGEPVASSNEVITTIVPSLSPGRFDDITLTVSDDSLEKYFTINKERINITTWRLRISVNQDLLQSLRSCYNNITQIDTYGTEKNCDISELIRKHLPDKGVSDQKLKDFIGKSRKIPISVISGSGYSNVNSASYLDGQFEVYLTFLAYGTEIKIGLGTIITSLPGGSNAQWHSAYDETTYTQDGGSTIYASDSTCINQTNTSNDVRCSETQGDNLDDPYFSQNITIPAGSVNWVWITAEGMPTASSTCNLGLWNFSGTPAYKTVATSACTTSADTTLSFNITGANLTYFVSNNVVMFTFALSSGGIDDLSMDYMAAIVSYNASINFSTPTTNDSDIYIGDSVNHTVDVQTGTGSTLASYIFSWNGTGASCGIWANSSAVALSGTSATIGVVQTIPTACEGKTIGWKIYANNSDSIVGNSSIHSYLAKGIPPTITLASVNPRFAMNGSVVNISANVTDDISVGTVIARIYYPNGTSAVNYTMTNTSGSIFWNASFTPNINVPGQYNVTIYANDTASSSATSQTYFTPILNLTNQTNIGIDGAFTDWNGVTTLDDTIGDAGTGGSDVTLDNEVMVATWDSLGGSGNITVYAYNSTSGGYDKIWNTSDTLSDLIYGGAVGDITHDGKNDIVIPIEYTATSSNGTAIFTYNSSSKIWYKVWTGMQFNSYNGISSILDLDNDTFTELIHLQSGGRLEIWGNDSDGGGEGITSLSLETSILNVSFYNVGAIGCDLDNDTIPEIIARAYSASVALNYLVYEWNGTAYKWIQNITNGEIGIQTDMDCGDIDRDGFDEVITCDGGDGRRTRVIDYTGGIYKIAYNSSQTVSATANVGSCNIVDLTNDGWPDFADASSRAGEGVRVYTYNSTSSTYYSLWNITYSGASNFAAAADGGDSDNDGKGEFIIPPRAAGESIRILENNTVNATSFNNTFNLTSGQVFTNIYIGDLDSDTLGGGGGGNNYDIKNYSLAHNSSYLFARISVNGSIDFSTATNYYALYLSTNDASTGSQYTAGGGLLPFLYDFRIQVNNSNCTIYNYANITIGLCNVSNSSNTIELRANLTLINMTTSSVVNITIETGGSSSFDMAPDYNSFLQYSTGAGETPANNPPTLDAYDTYPDAPTTTDDLVFNITCGDSDGGDTITAYLQIFNGSASFKNISQVVTASTVTTLWVVGNLNTTKGQNWNATYWCGNGSINTSKSWDNVTILNTAPTVPSSLSLNAVNVSSVLTGGCGGSSDVDGDTVTYNYYFYNVNDSSQLQAWSATVTYTIQSTDAHNQINVTCRAITTDANSSGNFTNFTSVDDSHPTIPTSLSLNAVNVSSVLTGGCGGSNDVDGDTVTYHYYFYNVNDSSQLQAWGGTNTYTAQSTDAHNQINVTCKATTTYENSSGNFTNKTSVDDSHPTLPTLDRPADNNLTSLNTPYFNWTVSTDADLDSITYGIQIDGDSGFGSIDQSNYALTTNNYTATTLADGVWYWHVKAITSYENSSYTNHRTLTIDTTAPTVNAVTPANNNFTNVNQPNFYFNFTDSISPNASCVLYVGASAYGSNATVINNTLTNITANSAITSGTYSWNVTCADVAGNSQGSAARTITVDTTAPSVNALVPADNNFTNVNQPNFYFNFTDSLSPNSSCVLYVGSTAYGINSSVLNNTLSNLTANASILDGSYSWNVTCADVAGNSQGSAARTITIDTTAPAVNINASLNNTIFTTDTPGIDFNYSDSLSPNVSCVLYFDDSSVDTNASVLNWTNTVLTASSRGEANYSVYINCTDLAGNIKQSGTLNIEIDLSGPVISDVVNDSITSETARINWSTDEEANSSVKYGEDTDLTTGEETSASLETAHSISLSGLSASTLYYYNVTSCDAQGWCNTTGPYNFTTTSALNSPPTIDSVDPVSEQSPVADSIKYVQINFTVNDANGIDNLNHSSAKAKASKDGLTREGNCSNNTVDSDTVKYNCSVPMNYYDPAGTWAINVSVRDLADAYANNTANTFDFAELLYISLSSTVFGFGEFYPGDTDHAALSNPLFIDNMGNVNLTQINITAYNLINGSYTIGVSNITVNVSDAPGTALQDSVMLNIPGANVSADLDGVDSNASLYFYISTPNVLPLVYSSSNDWVITADK